MANIPTKNNNPGDLKDPSTGTFRTFSDPAQGYAALANDLQYKMTNHPDWNLGDFAKVYAPPSDNNDTAQYVANLANQLGVPPTTKISSLQPQMGKFVQAIAHNEGFNGQSAIQPKQPQVQPKKSDTPNLAAILGIGGGILGAGGLIAANLLAPEVAVPAEEAATGGAEAAAGGGLLSSLMGGAATAAEVKGGMDTASGLYSAFKGNSSSPAPEDTPQLQIAQKKQTDESITPAIGVSKTQPAEPQELEQQLPQATQASQKVAQLQNQMLQGTPSGSVLAQEREMQEGMGANARYGIVGESDENGRYDASGTVEKANKLLDQMDNANGKVLEAEGSSANAQDLKNDMRKQIDEGTSDPEERAAAHQLIESKIDAYAKEYGDSEGNIPLKYIHEMKKDTGHRAKFGIADPNSKKTAYRAINQGAKKAILKNTYHKDFYAKMLKEEQAIINGKKVNKRLNGKKIPQNKNFMRDLLKQGGGALGIYIGDKIGGPLGAILGNMVGEKISRAADKRHGRNIFESKGMRAALGELRSISPAVYKVIEKELKQAEQRTENKKAVLKEKGLQSPEAAIKNAQIASQTKKVGSKEVKKVNKAMEARKAQIQALRKFNTMRR